MTITKCKEKLEELFSPSRVIYNSGEEFLIPDYLIKIIFRFDSQIVLMVYDFERKRTISPILGLFDMNDLDKIILRWKSILKKHKSLIKKILYINQNYDFKVGAVNVVFREIREKFKSGDLEILNLDQTFKEGIAWAKKNINIVIDYCD